MAIASFDLAPIPLYNDDAQGRLTDETTKEYITKLLVALADWTRRPRRQ
jgi:hypothetical protein